MLQDFQHAWRLFVRSRGFSLVAMATLTGGIGANTAVFSVLEAVILKPPAYRDPSRLVVLSRFDKKKNQVFLIRSLRVRPVGRAAVSGPGTFRPPSDSPSVVALLDTRYRPTRERSYKSTGLWANALTQSPSSLT
jgi:hypothetical protein